MLMEKAMSRDKISLNDRQLACAKINSPEGQVPNETNKILIQLGLFESYGCSCQLCLG